MLKKTDKLFFRY